MDKYTIAPPAGSTNNSVGAEDRPWKLGHFDALKLGGGDLAEYLAESTGYGIVSGCETSISGLTVTVGAGIVHLADGTRKEISVSSITLDAADSTNPRIDLVYIDSTGTVAKITGTAAASPSALTVPSDGISVAQVSVATGAAVGVVVSTELTKRLIGEYTPSIINSVWQKPEILSYKTPSVKYSIIAYNMAGGASVDVNNPNGPWLQYYRERFLALDELIKSSGAHGVAISEVPFAIDVNPNTIYNRIYMPHFSPKISSGSYANFGVHSAVAYASFDAPTDSSYFALNATEASHLMTQEMDVVKINNKDVLIVPVHLVINDTTQLNNLLSEINNAGYSNVIIAGDFNNDYSLNTDWYTLLTNAGYSIINQHSYITEPDINTGYINIAYKGNLTASNVTMVDTISTGLSDHKSLYAEFE